MNRTRKVKLGMVVAVLVLLLAPSLSQAQLAIGIGGRRGGAFVGAGRYGGDRYYGNNYYGNDYYGNRFYGDSYGRSGVYFSSPYFTVWPQSDYYSVAPQTTYYSSPMMTTSVAPAASSYQSFYPSQGVASNNDGRSTLVVTVPPNATTWFNGSRSSLSGPVRQYVTLPLRSTGAQYEVSASWTDQNGQTVSRTHQVQAMPNQVVRVDFMNNDQNPQAANMNNQQAPMVNGNANAGEPPAPLPNNIPQNLPPDNAITPPVPQ